jgi:nucleoid DNA-binding protein
MVQVVFRRDPTRTNGAIVSRVVPRSTIEFEDLLEYMAKGVLVETSDMKVVFDQFADALRYFLSKGNRVQTSFGTFSMSLRRSGVSSSNEAGLAKSTERSITTDFLNLRLRPTKGFLETLKLATSVEVLATPSLQIPLIYKVENADKKGVLDSGSGGEILHLSGDRMSFSKDDEDLGVFFVSQDETAEVHSAVYRNGSSIVDCKIPTLVPGSYRLEVRTRPTNKDVRVGVYPKPIMIV